jgi:hypothetical protein
MFSGGIIAWSGAIVNIPTGWVLCDGNNGTPNLQNRMIIGAGDTYAVAAIGGATSHGHSDTFAVENDETAEDVDLGAQDVSVAESGHGHVLSGAVTGASSLNPYYALAFIMKT